MGGVHRGPNIPPRNKLESSIKEEKPVLTGTQRHSVPGIKVALNLCSFFFNPVSAHEFVIRCDAFAYLIARKP